MLLGKISMGLLVDVLLVDLLSPLRQLIGLSSKVKVTEFGLMASKTTLAPIVLQRSEDRYSFVKWE